MAQAAVSTSDLKTPKGGGPIKKPAPERQLIVKSIQQVQEVLPEGTIWGADAIERVLEKHNYDVGQASDYILDGNPMLSEWHEVSKKQKEPKVKATQPEKRNGNEGKEAGSDSKKEKVGDGSAVPVRNDRGDDKGGRPPKGKKPFREGVTGEGAPERGADGRRPPRDNRPNGSPRTGPRHNTPGHTPSAAAPGQKPQGPPPATTTPPQSHPQQQPHQQQQQQIRGPPPATTTPPSNRPPHPQQQRQQGPPQAQQQQQQPHAIPSPTPSTVKPPAPSAAKPPPPTPPSQQAPSQQKPAALSYSKILQGKPTPPPPQQKPAAAPSQPTPPQQKQAAALPPSSSSSTPSPSASQSQQQQQGSRGQPRNSSPQWRPKGAENGPASLTQTPSAPVPAPAPAAKTAPAPSSAKTPAAAPSAPSPATTTPAPSSQPVSAPAPSKSSAPIPSAQPAQAAQHAQPTQPAQAHATQQHAQPSQPHPHPPAQQQPIQAPIQPPIQAPIQPPTQPSPISPPSQAKKQNVYAEGNLRLPPSLQFADNLSFQFGSHGLPDSQKDQGFVLNFGTHPSGASAPVQPVTAQPPIQPPIQQPSPVAPPSAPSPSSSPAVAPSPAAQQHPAQHISPAQQHAAQHPAQQHPAQPAPAQQAPHVISAQQGLHQIGSGEQQPQHVAAGHVVPSAPEDLQQHMGYPTYLPPFYMPFGFSESTPDDRLRGYPGYEHQAAAYGAADSSSSPSSVSQQSSQSPPPQSQSQYPIPSSYYPPYVGVHPYYYQSPNQFQQFAPPNYMPYKPNYNYGRMGSAGGYPNVHPSSSPATAQPTHPQYDDQDAYNKYNIPPQQYPGFAGYGAQGAQGGVSGAQGSAGSAQPQQAAGAVGKTSTAFSPSSTPPSDASKDYNKYGHRDSSSFYNMGAQPAFSPHTSHAFMQQHLPQNMMPTTQGVYHQPLSNNTVTGQSGGAPRSHYTPSALS